jgi:hypothetical protein
MRFKSQLRGNKSCIEIVERSAGTIVVQRDSEGRKILVAKYRILNVAKYNYSLGQITINGDIVIDASCINEQDVYKIMELLHTQIDNKELS